ncbi:MAG: VWA domain-containing protein [Oscillospiraceae bacterium]|jgi:uncharacterized protein YegL|nr:VWA domain-containing protein [Oscillospiraceae bacterium]
MNTVQKNNQDNAIDRPVREASQPHIALALVLDVSASMQGASIIALNGAVNGMISQMQSDPRLRNIVDLSIFLFGTYGRPVIHQGFRAIADCALINLPANDRSTYVVEALDRALEVTRVRYGIYDKAGGSYKPWIVLITDGEFHDGADSLGSLADKLRQRESRGKHQFFGLGVRGYDRRQMESLTNDPAHIVDVEAANFREFFTWVGRSLRAVSTKDPGASVTLEPLVFTV